ncbi:hypothetical protein BT63DRAFT_255003 [Microthyrium microscopicum]|uniref:Cora-domain-containing protein n=1 Tax=Microthyrium microscopicum TaxID=703497 RepID=A0A6A6UBA1_9PEZI|nr:hypothetical protein BT63DRAFT_255003 [Microthyrium microscopicum]
MHQQVAPSFFLTYILFNLVITLPLKLWKVALFCTIQSRNTMDCLETFQYDRYLKDASTFGTFGGACFFEVTSDGFCRRGQLDHEDSVIKWLDSQSQSSSSASVTRLRLLAIPHALRNRESLLPLPISKTLFHDISTAMQLCPSYLQALSSGMATYLRSCSPLSDDRWKCAKFIFQENSYSSCPFSIAITYKGSECRVDALMFGAPFVTPLGVYDTLMLEIFQYLNATSPLIAGPMLLPIMIKELMVKIWTGYVDQCHQELFDVELATRMRKGLANVPYASITDDTVPELGSIDLVDITRSLNSTLTKIAFSSMQCQSSRRVLSFVSDMNSDFQMNVATAELSLQSLQAHLQAKVEHLQSWFEGIEARCIYLTQRAQAQTQTVYSLIAQRDNAVNLRIAEASRSLAEASRRDNTAMKAIAEDSKIVALATARDSASMRIIAIVTILFLPATFTAALFSTSFFDFHPRNPSKVVSTWVWLYCAVTALLTLLIQGFWYYTSRRKEREISEGISMRHITRNARNTT